MSPNNDNKTDEEVVQETKDSMLQSLIDLGANQDKIDAMKKSMEAEKNTPVVKPVDSTPIDSTYISAPAETKFTSYDEYQKAQELLKVFEEDKQNKEEPKELVKTDKSPKALAEEKYKKDLENFLVSIGYSWVTEADKEADLWIWEKFGKFKRTEAKDSTDAKVHIEFESPDKNPYWSNGTLKKERAEVLMQATSDQPEYVIGKELISLKKEVEEKIGEKALPELNDTAKVYVERLMYKLEEFKEAKKESEEENKPFIKPEDKTIQGIGFKAWNNAIDYMFRQKDLKFETYGDYEKENKLQQLFGRNKEEIKYIDSLKKNAKVIRMDYFRDLPTWQIVEKIPARYFFDFKDVKKVDGSDLSKEELIELFKAGLLKQEIILVDNEPINNYSYTREEELEQISKDLESSYETSPKPIGYETMEQYIARLTKNPIKYNLY